MVSCDRRNGKMILSSVTNVRACEPEPEPRAYFASHCACFLFLFFKFLFNVLFFYSVLKCYTWLQKQKFSIFFRALNSAQVVFVCIKFNFIKRLMVSDINEIWVSLANFRIKILILTGNFQVRQSLGNYQDDRYIENIKQAPRRKIRGLLFLSPRTPSCPLFYPSAGKPGSYFFFQIVSL